VSDANLVLGYLNPQGLLAGRLPLDRDAAYDAIKRRIADPLGLSVEQAAYGVFTIVNSNMVNGIRRVSVERGYDPRDFVLVGAGGATAAHITALARDMGIGTVVIPKLASGLCAFGQIISDVRYNYMSTYPVRLEGEAVYARIDEIFRDLETEGVRHLAGDGFAEDRIAVRRSLDMRYVGQVHECTVEVGNFPIDGSTIGEIVEAFHRRHQELYTYAERHNPVEVVNIESTISGLVEKPPARTLPGGGSAEEAVSSRRPAIFSADGEAITVPVYDGRRLRAGHVITGPAIVEEPTTTIVVEPGWTAVLHESGSYVLTGT
jgi:N-methylhydantoinase A